MTDLWIHIITEKIEDFTVPDPYTGAYGAEVIFEGVIRPEELGKKIEGIEFEAYESMAKKVIITILKDLRQQHGFLAAEAIHRIGRIAVGESAIRVKIWAAHRAEAFKTITEFMDRLKQDVPIWKVRTF